jgi:hypothetical protein
MGNCEEEIEGVDMKTRGTAQLGDAKQINIYADRPRELKLRWGAPRSGLWPCSDDTSWCCLVNAMWSPSIQVLDIASILMARSHLPVSHYSYAFFVT